MNLIQWMAGMFTRRPNLNGEVEQIQRAGREDGQRLAGAYVDGFVAGASSVLEGAQTKFLGYDGHESIGHDDAEDAEYEPALTRTEIRKMRKPKLIEELRQRQQPTEGTAKELTERLLEVAAD